MTPFFSFQLESLFSSPTFVPFLLLPPSYAHHLSPQSVHLIEFPSLLLPPGVGPGSIVNIACARNVSAEKAAARDFWDLQRDIFESFGADEPTPPKLQVRNTTQTSVGFLFFSPFHFLLLTLFYRQVTLEWDKLELASSSLISLSMYRNGQRLTTIPNPLNNTSTKLSGLQLDTDYSFHLVLKTTAGTFSSPVVKTRTHTIDNTTGIHVCFGLVHPPELFEEAKKAVQEMGASHADKIEIHTTHYIGTSSASRQNPQGGPGVEYQKALQLSIVRCFPLFLFSLHAAHTLNPTARRLARMAPRLPPIFQTRSHLCLLPRPNQPRRLPLLC